MFLIIIILMIKQHSLLRQIKQQISPDKIIINLKNNFNLDSITTAKFI